jgi:outer membrane protein OmpA-like peptidoglycan-associated protein
MPKLFLFLFLFGGISFAQPYLNINVVDTETAIPIPGAVVNVTDENGQKYEFRTDVSGSVSIKSTEYHHLFIAEQNLKIEVIGQDSLYQGTTKTYALTEEFWNSDFDELFIEVDHMYTHHQATEIYFLPDSDSLYADTNSRKFNTMTEMMLENPSVIVEVRGIYYTARGSKLGKKRAEVVRNKMILGGVNPMMLRSKTYRDSGWFQRNERFETGADFRILEWLDKNPCTGHLSFPAINFTIGGYEVVETECDSVRFIEQMVKENPKAKWRVIGINYKAADKKARELAASRAQIVKDILMMAGVEEWDIIPSTHYYPRMKSEDELKWPYLKSDLPYEIGVYIEKK